jgi:hypothetical protein
MCPAACSNSWGLEKEVIAHLRRDLTLVRERLAGATT